MKPRMLRLLGILVFSVCCATAQTQFIVSASPTAIAKITAHHGLTLVETLNSEGGVYLVTAPAGTPVQQVSVGLSADATVQAFESNTIVQEPETEPASKVTANISQMLSALSNTATENYFGSMVRTAYVNQPAVSIVDLPQAHKRFPTGAPIVAVIDTGVDPSHPALVHSLVSGYDFTRNQPGIPNELLDLNAASAGVLAQSSVTPSSQKTQPFELSQSTVVILDQSTVVILDGGGGIPSDFGHGTMVAGLIHLVAPTTLIMPLKAFQADGSANLSDIIRAVYYAADHGAKVISMSFDTETPSPALNTAIQYANAHGVVCVAAAGNEGEQEVVYPAGSPHVIGVASSSDTDGRSVFTNYGVPSVFMTAPGEALITAYPGNNYAGVWGTSFSTALVSGTVAILAQMDPLLAYRSTLEPLENGHEIDPALGLGDSRLDVLLTLQSLGGEGFRH